MAERIVVFDPEGKVAEATEGEGFLDVAARAAVTIDSACGGQGTCGRCRLKLLWGDIDVESWGPLEASDVQAGIFLACQARVKTDCVVEVPVTSQLTEFQILENQTPLGADWLAATPGAPTPLARRLRLSVPAPTLASPLSHLARLRRELSSADPALVDLPAELSALRALPGALARGEGRLDVLLADFDGMVRIMDVAEAGGRPCCHGLAVDVGTTTLVVHLVDLETGTVIDIAGSHNEQIRYGDDVISRIVWTQEAGEGGIRAMRDAVLGTLNRLIGELAERHDLAPQDLCAAVLSGNTVMTHFLLGVDASSIRREPYVPVARRFPTVRAEEVGLDIRPSAPVMCQPCVAGYVGGDITSGVLATGLAYRPELAMLIDIGTNGEIVVGNNEWLVACSCSAGPAFEGVGIKYGMRATRGAIERASYDPQTDRLELRVIGETRPRGVCGSGLLDLLATLFRGRVLDRSGHFNPNHPTKRLRVGPDGPEFVLAWGSELGREDDIILLEADVENLIRSKAAMFAGASVLMESMGLSPQDLRHVYVAGAFGNYLDIPNAVLIGMLPDIARERMRFVGNTSVAGARLSLLSRQARERAKEIARRITYLELSADNRFMERYVAGLFLPHTDLTLFPSVADELELWPA